MKLTRKIIHLFCTVSGELWARRISAAPASCVPHNPTCDEVLSADPTHRVSRHCDEVLAGDGTLRGLRSAADARKPPVSRPDIVRSGASRRRHALPRLALLRADRSIDLHHQPVRLALGRWLFGGLPSGSRQRGRLCLSSQSGCALASRLSRHHFVENRNRTLKLLVRHGFDRVGMLDLVLLGISRARTFKYTPGWSRRTLATAFSPCCRKSRKSAQMTSSLNALREPRGRPAGLPDCPWLPKVDRHVCAGAVLMLGNRMIALSIRQSGRSQRDRSKMLNRPPASQVARSRYRRG